VELLGEAEIRCGSCHYILFVPGSDIFVDRTDRIQRAMGSEDSYAGSTQFDCPNCENEIEISYSAFEYPTGALNHSETEVSGGKLIRGFGDIDVAFGEVLYSLEKEELYLPEEKHIITVLEPCVVQLITDISNRPELVRQVEPRQFEEVIAHVFSKHGFSVELTKQTRDGGRDIIAIRSDLGISSKFIVECKRYSADNPIRVDLVRNLYGVQMQEGANKSILATTSYFTPDAKKFTKSVNTTLWGMDLKDYDDVIGWIKSTSRN